MEQERIFISMSPEVQELLADNGIDLVTELRREIPEVRKDYAPDPASAGESRTKDPVLIILASAAAFAAVSMGITKIVDALARNKKVVVTARKLVPIPGPSGEVVRDKDGQPILQWVEETRIVEAQRKVQDKSKLDVSILGLTIKLESNQE